MPFSIALSFLTKKIETNAYYLTVNTTNSPRLKILVA